MSKRVSLAVKRMRNDNNSVETNNKKSDSPKKISTSTIPNDIPDSIMDKKRRKTQN